jgi:hypothetical protein
MTTTVVRDSIKSDATLHFPIEVCEILLAPSECNALCGQNAIRKQRADIAGKAMRVFDDILLWAEVKYKILSSMSALYPSNSTPPLPSQYRIMIAISWSYTP